MKNAPFIEDEGIGIYLFEVNDKALCGPSFEVQEWSEENSMKSEFLLALIGGVLIGTASALPLWWQGRIAGASGLLSNILLKNKTEKLWGFLYALGLISGAFVVSLLNGNIVSTSAVILDWKLLVGAVLVGFGARLGGGCTSGHGICGMARLSLRSIVATVCFVATAMLVANLVRYLQW